MANDLMTGGRPAFLKKQEPANQDKFLSPTLDKLNRVTLKGGRLTLQQGGEDRELGTQAELIIVDAAPGMTKMFFSKPYQDTEEVVLPDCWSEDGVAPAASIQGPVSSKCSGCPKNLWGSKVTANGKKAKACTDYKKLVVMEPGAAIFYEMRVPPASLNEWNEYVKRAAQGKVGVEQVVTRINYDKNFILHFAPARWITEADFKMIENGKEDIERVKKAGIHLDATLPSEAPREERLNYDTPGDDWMKEDVVPVPPQKVEKATTSEIDDILNSL